MTADHDFADRLIASWAASRPDLDVTPVAVTTRLARVRDYIEGESAAVFGEHGLTAPRFVSLATLARLGTTTEAAMAAELGLPEGTVASRVDQLVRDGVAERGGDGAVALTARGRDLADAVVPAHLERQARLLSALTREEQAALSDLLRTLLLSLEG